MFFFLFLTFVVNIFGIAPLSALSESGSTGLKKVKIKRDSYVHALASLAFHLHELKFGICHPSHPPRIPLSIDQANGLWNKAYSGALLYSQEDRPKLIKDAYTYYQEGRAMLALEERDKAKTALYKCVDILENHWSEILEQETGSPYDRDLKKRQRDPNVLHNPHLGAVEKKAMHPYLLSVDHPMRKVLDSIFLNGRATLNKDIFFNAGFRTLANGPRSHIVVAKHCDMPGYLVKAYLDTELERKYHKESWEWLVRRCEGARKISTIIHKRKSRLFTVAKKWIYCLPPDPSPPQDNPIYTRHLALLLVTDMKLAPRDENYQAWQKRVTEKHLDELFAILARAKGASYRPDNIAYTRDGLFAFIDTEYPNSGPDFKSIRRYLSDEMRGYWDELIRAGGP